MANNYGSAEGVALLSRSYTNSSGEFDATTTPTLDQVEQWLDQVSSSLNAELATAYFTVPVTNALALPALDNFVNNQVAKKVESIHMRGRRGPTTIQSQSDRFDVTDGVTEFVQSNRRGFAGMGAEIASQFVFKAY